MIDAFLSTPGLPLTGKDKVLFEEVFSTDPVDILQLFALLGSCAPVCADTDITSSCLPLEKALAFLNG